MLLWHKLLCNYIFLHKLNVTIYFTDKTELITFVHIIHTNGSPLFNSVPDMTSPLHWAITVFHTELFVIDHCASILIKGSKVLVSTYWQPVVIKSPRGLVVQVQLRLRLQTRCQQSRSQQSNSGLGTRSKETKQPTSSPRGCLFGSHWPRAILGHLQEVDLNN